MNKKVYHTLEYYKILDMLAGYAACEETRKRALALTPITDAAEIEHLQQTTSDALSRLYKGSGISFAGIHNVNASLKRLDIGGSLNTTELLHICSLLEVAKRAKAYDRSDRADDKTDSLSPLFSQIEPLSPLLEEIKRCVIGEDEIADDASPALFKIRKSILQSDFCKNLGYCGFSCSSRSAKQICMSYSIGFYLVLQCCHNMFLSLDIFKFLRTELTV